MKLKRIKKAIPPLFSKVCELTRDLDISVEKMNLTAETFTITNDLMKKSIKRADGANLKKVLSIMPSDF
jgi:hypothetical protein